MELIRELEGMDRGRYAGPVGWVDARGNGEWGIALRCAEVDGAPGAAVRGRRHRQRLGPRGRAGRDPGQVPAHAVRARSLTPPRLAPRPRARPYRQPLRCLAPHARGWPRGPAWAWPRRQPGPARPARAAAAVQAARSRPRSAVPAARLVAHLHHPDPGPRASRSPRKRARQARRPLQRHGGDTGGGGDLAERPAVRGAEHPLEGCGERGLLQQREDPAPVVVDHDQHQVGARLLRPGEQAGRIVQERQVAEQGDGGAAPGPLMGERRPARGGDQAVDAARAPAGQHRDSGPRRHLLIEVADGEAGGGPQQRPVRQGGRQVAGEPGLAGGVIGVEDGGGGGARRRVRGQPRRQPSGAGRARARPAGPPRRRRWRSGPDPPSAPAPARSRRAAAARRPARPSSGSRAGRGTAPAGRPRRSLPAGARPRTRRESSRYGYAARAPGPVRAPEDGSASTGQPASAASRSSAAGSAQPSPQMTTPRSVQGSSSAGGAVGRADHRPGRSRRPGPASALRPAACVARPRPHRDPGARGPPRPASPRRSAGRHPPASGHERLAQAQVEVNRPRHGARRPRGGRPGAAGQGAPVGVHPRPGLRHADLAEPAHRAPVQLQLVDRLVRAGATQLRGPVGGEHEQRHARLVGLDHRRVEMRGRGARRADHRDRPAAHLRQPQREERGRPLIDPHVQPQAPRAARRPAPTAPSPAARCATRGR